MGACCGSRGIAHGGTGANQTLHMVRCPLAKISQFLAVECIRLAAVAGSPEATRNLTRGLSCLSLFRRTFSRNTRFLLLSAAIVPIEYGYCDFADGICK